MMSRKAFTLIELLIVVAIIGVLAAIAVPNLQQAMVKSKVVRSMADMRNLGLAIEAYRIDHNDYPYYSMEPFSPEKGHPPRSLTTPVAYFSYLPQDPFDPTQDVAEGFAPASPNPMKWYHFEHKNNWNNRLQYDLWEGRAPNYDWALVGAGPDRWPMVNEGPGGNFHSQMNEYGVFPQFFYNISNGIISFGDVILKGPGISFEFQPSGRH